MSNNYPPTELEEMRDLTATEFEDFVADIYSLQGYDTKRIQLSNDRGRDVVADKDGERMVIQAKRYAENNRIGIEEVQKYSSILHENDVDKVALVTTSTLTGSAWETENRIDDLKVVTGGQLEDRASKHENELEQTTNQDIDETSSKGLSRKQKLLQTPSLPSPSAGYSWLFSPHPDDRWRNMVSISLLLLIAGFVGLLASESVRQSGMVEGLSLLSMGIGWLGSSYSVYKDMAINLSRSRIVMMYSVMAVTVFPGIGPLAYLKIQQPNLVEEE